MRQTASPLTNASLYGKGVFTTIAIIGGEPFLWDQHWQRLTSHALKLGIDAAEYSESIVAAALSEKLAKHQLGVGRARITLLDGTVKSHWSTGSGGGTELLIGVGERRNTNDKVKLAVSPFRSNSRSPVSGIKSCNYLEHLMAFENASSAGFDEAIRLNERGVVTSACMANIFWMNDGRLMTPGLETGCLAGTTRDLVMRSYDCEETSAGIEELASAERIFLTSAGIGIKVVEEFDGRRLNASHHPILDLFPK